ncbi:MAG: GatB/YqeY domain-containing protein [Eubacteriaceae bacterium]|nr:GatB/YqeY domain-containing protein [Eubacteriaceae bacterium]
MTLKEQLLTDLKSAMKSKDKVAKDTVTMIRAAVLQKEKDTKAELEDNEILDIIAKQHKQRKDALADFVKAGRDDLIETTNQEIAIIKKYLPEQLSREEIEKIVDETIEEVGATSMKEMGKVMGKLMPKVKGVADGKVVNEIVREKLS